MPLRDARPADFECILALNAESVHFLSPLAPERLAHLHAQAAYHRVVASDGGEVQAFLLALPETAIYDSPNFHWFAASYPRFLYIDRVVVSAAHQGQGLGRLLYDNLIAFARTSGIARVACEFDVDPPNPASERFHAGYGFAEVGTQHVGPARKRVSLQVLDLG
jgi:uncharacterized protein